MAADGDLASILERLPDATDQVEALQELKIVIASLPPAVLRDVLPNLSFNPVFDCLNVSDRSVSIWLNFSASVWHYVTI